MRQRRDALWSFRRTEERIILRCCGDYQSLSDVGTRCNLETCSGDASSVGCSQIVTRRMVSSAARERAREKGTTSLSEESKCCKNNRTIRVQDARHTNILPFKIYLCDPPGKKYQLAQGVETFTQKFLASVTDPPQKSFVRRLRKSEHAHRVSLQPKIGL